MEKPRIIRIVITTVIWAFICFCLMFVMNNYLNIQESFMVDILSVNKMIHKNSLFFFPLLAIVIFAVFEIVHSIIFKYEIRMSFIEERMVIANHLLISAIESCCTLFVSLSGLLVICHIKISWWVLMAFSIFAILCAIIYFIHLCYMKSSRGKYDEE